MNHSVDKNEFEHTKKKKNNEEEKEEKQKYLKYL